MCKQGLQFSTELHRNVGDFIEFIYTASCQQSTVALARHGRCENLNFIGLAGDLSLIGTCTKSSSKPVLTYVSLKDNITIPTCSLKSTSSMSLYSQSDARFEYDIFLVIQAPVELDWSQWIMWSFTYIQAVECIFGKFIESTFCFMPHHINLWYWICFSASRDGHRSRYPTQECGSGRVNLGDAQYACASVCHAHISHRSRRYAALWQHHHEHYRHGCWPSKRKTMHMCFVNFS